MLILPRQQRHRVGVHHHGAGCTVGRASRWSLRWAAADPRRQGASASGYGVRYVPDHH